MSRLIIGLVGRKGSGKGTVAKILHDRYGADVHRYSDILRTILDQLFIDKSRENLVKLSEILRHGFGEDILKRVMTKKIELEDAPLVVIDGIRRTEDLEGLDQLGDFTLVTVDAPLETRFERLRLRGENAGESTRTMESFVQMEHASTEVTIGEVEHLAWKKITNAGTYEELVSVIDDMMKELGRA